MNKYGVKLRETTGFFVSTEAQPSKISPWYEKVGVVVGLVGIAYYVDSYSIFFF